MASTSSGTRRLAPKETSVANDKTEVFLPRMRTRPGQSHSYQQKPGSAIKITVIDSAGKTAPAGKDPSVLSTEKPTKRGRTGGAG